MGLALFIPKGGDGGEAQCFLTSSAGLSPSRPWELCERSWSGMNKTFWECGEFYGLKEPFLDSRDGNPHRCHYKFCLLIRFFIDSLGCGFSLKESVPVQVCSINNTNFITSLRSQQEAVKKNIYLKKEQNCTVNEIH